MAQHFLLSREAKTLSLVAVCRMSDAEAEKRFRAMRWTETNGEPICPECGCVEAYEMRRPSGLLRFECKACKKGYTLTSGTLFASHKLPLRMYLAAIAVFCNEVKGKSALAFSRDMGISYKAAFVMCHKLREAMAEDMRGRVVGGENKEVEIVMPKNYKEERVDRRLRLNQSGKRQCVVIVRERGGNSVPGVFKSEGAALSWTKSRIAKETTVHADESNAWNDLHARFEMKRINHEYAYSHDGACTNQAESFFSRLRRGEQGHHHHIAGQSLLRYAQEASWREDNRRVSNGEQVYRVAHLALSRGPSVDFSGYWQRHKSQ